MIAASLQLQSTAFANGDPIPPAHTCDGADRSPPNNPDVSVQGKRAYLPS